MEKINAADPPVVQIFWIIIYPAFGIQPVVTEIRRNCPLVADRYISKKLYAAAKIIVAAKRFVGTVSDAHTAAGLTIGDLRAK